MPFIAIALAWLLILVFAVALMTAAQRADRRTAAQLRGAPRAPAEPQSARPPAGPAPAPTRPELYGSMLLKRLAIQARRILAADRCAILIEEAEDPRSLVVIAAHGVDEAYVGARIPSDSPLLVDALHRGRHVVGDVGGSDTELTAMLGGSNRAVVAPIVLPDGGRGALVAASDLSTPGGGPDGAALAHGLGELAAAAIDDVRRHDHLEHAIVGAPLALRELVAAHRRARGEPGGDDGALADRVGRVLGLDPIALIELRLAATLKDIGRLLLENGEPVAEDDEYAAAEAAAAAEVLAHIPGLEVVAIIVRHCAEHWSGRGGPDGLAAERIPLASRILAACSVYERLTESPDPLAELWGQAGARFDPVVVGALAEATSTNDSPSSRRGLRGWARRDLTFAE